MSAPLARSCPIARRGTGRAAASAIAHQQGSLFNHGPSVSTRSRRRDTLLQTEQLQPLRQADFAGVRLTLLILFQSAMRIFALQGPTCSFARNSLANCDLARFFHTRTLASAPKLREIMSLHRLASSRTCLCR
jgi:hypothetical protein